MRFRHEMTFPRPVGQVAAMLANPEFAAWCARQITPDGEVDFVDVAGDAEAGFTVTVRRRVSSSYIPAQFQRLVGDELEVRQAEVWEPERDGRRVGTVALEITGTPVLMTGTVELAPDGAGSVLAYDGEIETGIPVFGAVIEQAAAVPVREGLVLAEAAGHDWLSRH